MNQATSTLRVEPAEDLEPEELWLLHNAKPWPSGITVWPRKIDGKEYRIRVKAAQQGWMEKARYEARKELLEEGYKQEDLDDVYIRKTHGDRVAQHVLAQTVYSAKPIKGTEDDPKGPQYKLMFEDAKHVRTSLIDEEVAVLYTAWQIIQSRIGPFSREITTEAELDLWIKKVAEGGLPFPLAQRNWLQLVELASSLCRRAYALSQILESQLPNLPQSLTVDLLKLNIGTKYFTEQPVTFTETGLSLTPWDSNHSITDSSGGLLPDIPGPEDAFVSLDLATSIAQKLYPEQG